MNQTTPARSAPAGVRPLFEDYAPLPGGNHPHPKGGKNERLSVRVELQQLSAPQGAPSEEET